MPNYNSQLQSNNTDLQEVLEILQTKAAGGEQATPEISVDSTSGLITATAGTKSSTYQLAFQAAKTITPSAVDQIAVSSGYYTGGNVTVKGDSNLVASNIKSGVSIFGVSGTLEEGSGSSGEAAEWSENEDAIISKSLSGTYTNDRVTSIGGYAFYSCINLTSVSFPAVTSIGANAFYRCSGLTTASFLAVTSIGNSAFYSCRNLTSVSFPVATSIGSSAFCCCSSLTSVSFPKVISIGGYAFNYCINLTSVNFPVATSIGSSAFSSCTSLTTISFPKATFIGNYAFRNCFSLTSVSFPVATTISSYAFYSCKSLTELYLTGSSRCSLANSNAFSNAGITSSTGSIYVPASLLTSYQTATNWAYFSTQFVGV